MVGATWTMILMIRCYFLTKYYSKNPQKEHEPSYNINQLELNYTNGCSENFNQAIENIQVELETFTKQNHEDTNALKHLQNIQEIIAAQIETFTINEINFVSNIFYAVKIFIEHVNLAIQKIKAIQAEQNGSKITNLQTGEIMQDAQFMNFLLVEQKKLFNE
ncbi:hypothetical protein COBT_004143, partial [Conglomerata obtusa]